MSPEEKVIHKKKKAKQQLVARMGVDPEKGWKAKYQILPGKEKVVSDLKKAAKNADQIYLATDLDREGEAIAWHLQESIGGDQTRYKRVVFNEITKRAVEDAFSEPGCIILDIFKVFRQHIYIRRSNSFMSFLCTLF